GWKKKSTKHSSKNLGAKKGWSTARGFYWTSWMLLSIFLKPTSAATTVARSYGEMAKWNTTKARDATQPEQGSKGMPKGPNRVKRIPNKKVTPKPPRFNIIWLWVAMFFGFFALQYLFTDDGAKEITYEEFEEKMLKPGDVDHLVAYKQNELIFVEVFIKKDRLDDPKYKNVQPSSNGLTLAPSTGPQYVFTEFSGEVLQRKLAEAQQDVPPEDRVSVKPEDRTNAWTGWIFSIMLPLLLIIVFWIFIMRRMGGGGGGPGGQIFNIGKSKATLFDKESQVAITF